MLNHPSETQKRLDLIVLNYIYQIYFPKSLIIDLAQRIAMKANQPLFISKQTGVSLIEVLVAIVIFSIGMLGSAGLQVASLRSNQYSSSSSIAVNAAREYSEMIQLTLPATSMTFALDSNNSLSAPTTCLGTAVTCTDKESFLYAQFDWLKRFQTTFPGGRVVVCDDTLKRDGSDLLSWDCTGGSGEWVAKFSWISKEKQTGGELFATPTDRPKFAVQLYGRHQLIDNTTPTVP